MNKDYPPLKLLAESKQPGREFISRKQQFMYAGCKNIDKMTSEDYIDYFLSDDFYNLRSTNKYTDISKILFMNEESMLEYAGITDELEKGNCDGVTEWRDIYLAPVLLEEWSKSKQIYKPDPIFADALLNTDKLDLSESMIKHLPYKYFYIDLSECKQFGAMAGVFVFIRYEEKKKRIAFSIYMLTNELVYFSYYSFGYFDNKGILKINFNEIKDHDYVMWSPAHLEDKVDKLNKDGFKLNKKSILMFTFQIIAYLSIEEPQLTESVLTKNTYKPKNNNIRVKNKWSEVRIQDVGVRYGNEFRKNTAKYINNSKTDNSDENKSIRKSPIPHFRCAHWQRFWTGKGRTELRLKWIEPVFVGNGTVDATIHRIKEVKETD